MISPYHYRVDWQIWFAAMSSIGREPWLLHLIDKLLAGDPQVKRLLAVDPFRDPPPRYSRADLYRYRFTKPGDGNPNWWRRSFDSEYLRPIAHDDRELRRYMRSLDWD